MAKSPRRRDISMKQAPERGGAAGKFHFHQHLIRLERGGQRADEKVRRVDPSLALRRLRAQPCRRASTTIAGISDAGSACARLPPMVPRLRICGCAICGSASAMSGRCACGRRIAFEVAVTRQRTDAQPLCRPVADPGKLLQRIDVDQHRRLRQPEIHCRNKTLTAGEKTRFVAVFGLQLQGLLDGSGGDVLERRWLHAAILPEDEVQLRRDVYRDEAKCSLSGRDASQKHARSICLNASNCSEILPNILSALNKGWARILRNVCQYLPIRPTRGEATGPTEQSVASASSPPTATQAAERMTPPQPATGAPRAANAAALTVDARGVSLTFQSRDGAVEALVQRQPANQRRRLRIVHRTVRLRQDHADAGDRRPRTADHRHDPGQWRQRRGSAAQAAIRLYLPGAGALSVAHHRDAT